MLTRKPLERRSKLVQRTPMRRTGFQVNEGSGTSSTTKCQMKRTPFKKTSRRVSKRIVDIPHLNFIRSLPCIVCGGPSCAHHVLRTPERAGGRKSDDCHTLPLCDRHHMALHAAGNETAYLERHAGLTEVTPVILSERIFAVSGYYKSAVAIITSLCNVNNPDVLQHHV